MKMILAAALAVTFSCGVALAQSPSNATISGGQSAPANGAGAASAASPTGQVNQSPVGAGTGQLPGDKAANQPTTLNSGSAAATTPTK